MISPFGYVLLMIVLLYLATRKRKVQERRCEQVWYYRDAQTNRDVYISQRLLLQQQLARQREVDAEKDLYEKLTQLPEEDQIQELDGWLVRTSRSTK